MSVALDTLYHNIFTTALEGGISYWSACSEYRWSVNGDGVTDDCANFVAVVQELYALEDPDDDESGKQHTIDRSVIAKGYRLATTEWKDKVVWSTEKPPLVVGPDTDWDFDAGDADCIVQLGLFGEVVYG